jgi:hypothetical protein
MRIDLHLHTTASDGVYSPSEVVQLALTHRLEVMALTDHDNVGGVAAAEEAANGKLQVLSGVELSAQADEERHILGYLVDIAYPPLVDQLALLRDSRVNRMEQMVTKLAALGLPISFESVLQAAGDGSVGRPHLARAMLERGYVTSVQDAFNRYLGEGGPAYVPYHRLTPEAAIALIHAAGGVAVLAHPGHYVNHQAIIAALVPHGLDGVEVYYYDHSRPVTEALYWQARRYGLLMTAGSDFHRRESDGSARIGAVVHPDGAALIDAMHIRAAQYR